MILRTFIILTLFANSLFAQMTFSDDEVVRLDSLLTHLDQKDSIHIHTISLLDNQLGLYRQQALLDSTLLFYKDQELLLLNNRVSLYIDLVNQGNPKWYDKKGLGFFIGAGSMIGSAILLDKIN